MFAALADRWPIERVLYPGSFVDLSPSTAFPSVVYVDSDPRAGRFFADPDLMAAELAGRTRPGAGGEVRFIGADYTHHFDLAEGSVDLLISLFAGPVWQHCGRYLRPGGWLLAHAHRLRVPVPAPLTANRSERCPKKPRSVRTRPCHSASWAPSGWG